MGHKDILISGASVAGPALAWLARRWRGGWPGGGWAATKTATAITLPSYDPVPA
jgi:hypothetical protein